MNVPVDIYREEANELLAELEMSLLELEEKPENMDLISKVFRSLHTIKGSGAMFGFNDIAEFAHEVETLFDLVRDRKIHVSRDLINLSLKARDQIKIMLDAHDENKANIDDAKTQAIIASLRSLCPTAHDISVDEPNQQRTMKSGSRFTYVIQFRPHPDIFISGTNPILLLNELRAFGEMTIMAHVDTIPSLDKYHPESCYTWWDITLTTHEGINAIRDVFIFVEDIADIHIETITVEGESRENNFRRFRDAIVQPELLVEKPQETEIVNDMIPEEIEGDILPGKKMGIQISSSIRVRADKLDTLINLVGELVIVQSRLSRKSRTSVDSELHAIAEEVERLITTLRDNAMSIRMVPISTTFATFKRLIRDLSEELEKQVELITEGGDTELDKTIIDKLNDPLIHIIRNCIDHGIELPSYRKQMGKPEAGMIRLIAEHSGANVLIHIRDDGAGLDLEKIREKAIQKGLIEAEAILSEKEIYELIFHPGISTSEKITEVSGRGVGMDVVKRCVDSIHGSVSIRSKRHEGTTFTIKLPLTLAIIDGLLIKIGDGHFVLPLLVVEECIEINRESALKAYSQNMLNLRGEIVPYISLRRSFQIDGTIPAIQQIVITEAKGNRIGLEVDQVIGQHQTVIKSLGRAYRNIEGLSGATILGDGTVALILDVPQLIGRFLKNDKM